MKYENLLIGDFIYSMGFACGKMGIENNRIDLLQQTPGDAVVGDLLGKFEGRNFIMEFKRDRKLLVSEASKSHKDFLLKNEIDKDLLLISAKSHFIGFWEKSQLLVNPYLFLNSKYAPKFPEPFPQEAFFKMLQTEKIGVDKNEIQVYLNFLAKNAKPSKTSSSSSSSSILVNYLVGRQPLVIEMSEGFTLEQKIEMEIGIEPKQNIQRGRGLGFDFGM